MTNKLLLILAVLLLAGCGPKPDGSLVLREQPSPESAAKAHAKEIGGFAVYFLDTGSMEPFIYGGDWVVIDPKFPFDKIKPGDLCRYLPYWEPRTVCHMVAAKTGDGWIMDGIANSVYERGYLRMTIKEYSAPGCGKVVKIYTKRK